jgi:DNA-binding GntR family transcriptional regulator
VTKLSLEDALQIFDVRIELEALAFSLAGRTATPQQIKELRDLAEAAKRGTVSDDLDVFFDNHLAFRKKIWELSGNRYLQQILERLVIPLYALYLIRRSYSREGLLQTAVDGVEHQDKILIAYEKGDFDEAQRVGREFLTRMKEYLSTRLVPTA